MEGNTKKVDATQAQKDGAKFLAQETAKANKGDNTIANSLGASMGNGPTSGVIGVGNNATFSLMEEQLDALKQIKDAIDRLGPISPMNTDFTKPEYPTA
jgi:imidazolonepropionase-like amidohydrolase